MRLQLTEDQVLLKETSERFIQVELPLSRTRDLHDHPDGFDRTWLEKAAGLGWFALLVPEGLGGGSVSGDGLRDLAIVTELQGAAAQPGPLIPMNLVALAVAQRGSEALHRDVLPGIVAGTTVATAVPAEEVLRAAPGAGVAARADGHAVTLDGRCGIVQGAGVADELLVDAVLDGQPVEVLVPTSAAGVVRRPLEGLDLGRRLAEVDLQGATVARDRVLVTTEGLPPGHGAEQRLRLAAVLTAADTVGAMDHLFTMTVAYAKDRIAFGRPIGSFQAIKHALADQAVALEASKAVAVAACDAVADGLPDAAAVASMAAAYVGDRGNELAQVCLQVHGGIGYTWEHDLHLLLRRIRANSALHGEPTWHREHLCALHGLGEEVPA